MDQFEFNAPQFTDFHSSVDSDDEEAEKYFDFDHECDDSHGTVVSADHKNDQTEEEVEFNSFKADESACLRTPQSRKSEFGVIIKKFEGLTLATPVPKSHQMETRQDKKHQTSPLILRSRSILRATEEITEEFQVRKRKNSKTNDERPEKYICMAEAIEKFQKATPARFHSKPRNIKMNFKENTHKIKRCTIPISPHLNVVHRNRPVTALSRQKIEEMEIEEMKKHQIKARPLNEKVLKPPSIDVSHRRHVTEFKPFNLTELKKKTQEPLPTVVKFTARPVPKGLLSKKDDRKNLSAPNLLRSHSDIPMRHRVPVTTITKDKENKVMQAKQSRKGPITAKPFSFAERDKMLLKKKEEKINKYLEEEKKSREFHANPLPKFSSTFRERPTIIPTAPQPFHLSADDKGQIMKEKWEKKVEEERRLMKEAAQFKAKPPKVLSQKPFLPIKSEHHSLELPQIHLNTEARAKERVAFDMKMKQKEEYLEKLKMERQKELEKIQEEQVSELRKQTVHKANPVRHYKNITIHPADKSLTFPVSPHSFVKK